MNSAQPLYRHGDVLVQRIHQLPPNLPARSDTVLAQGEVTSHAHRVMPAQGAQLWQGLGELFLEVKQPHVRIVHEEHRAIELPPGLYRVWKQREYQPGAVLDYREVED